MSESTRITTLEERFAHLERLVNELNDVVYRQQQELDVTRQQIAQLKDKLSGDPGIVDPAQQDRPPHY